MQTSFLPSKADLGARSSSFLDADISVGSDGTCRRRSSKRKFLAFAQESTEGSGKVSVFVVDSSTGQKTSSYLDLLPAGQNKSRVRVAVSSSQVGALVQGSNLVWFGITQVFASAVISNAPWKTVDLVASNPTCPSQLLVLSGDKFFVVEAPTTREQAVSAEAISVIQEVPLSGQARGVAALGETVFIVATDSELLTVKNNQTSKVSSLGAPALALTACPQSGLVLAFLADGSWQLYSTTATGTLSSVKFNAGCGLDESRCGMLSDQGALSVGSIMVTNNGFVALGYSKTARQAYIETWTLNISSSSCTPVKENSIEQLDDRAQPVMKLVPNGRQVSVFQHTASDIAVATLPAPTPVAIQSAELGLATRILNSEVKDLAALRSEAEQMMAGLERDTVSLIQQLNGGKTAINDRVAQCIDSVIALETVANAMKERELAAAQDGPALLEGGTISDQIRGGIVALYVKLHALRLLASGGFDAAWWNNLKQAEKKHRSNAVNFAKLFQAEFQHVVESHTIQAACFPTNSGALTCVQLILDNLGFQAGSAVSLEGLLTKLSATTDRAQTLPLVATLILFLAPAASSQAQTQFLVACDLPVALTYWGKLLHAADVGAVSADPNAKATVNKQAIPRALPQLPHRLSGQLLLQSFEHLLHAGVFDVAEQLGSQILESVAELSPRATVRLSFLAHVKKQLSSYEAIFLLVSPADWQLKTVVLAMMVDFSIIVNQVDFIERVSLDDATTDVVVDLMKARPMVKVSQHNALTAQEAQYRCRRLLVQFLSKKRRHRHALAECEELISTCDPAQAQQTLAVASTLRSLIKGCPDEVNVQGLSSAPESAIVEARVEAENAEMQMQEQHGAAGPAGGANAGPTQQTQMSMAVLLQQQQQQAAAAQQASAMNQQQLGGGVSRWPPYQTPQRGATGTTRSTSFGGPVGSGAGAAFGM